MPRLYVVRLYDTVKHRTEDVEARNAWAAVLLAVARARDLYGMTVTRTEVSRAAVPPPAAGPPVPPRCNR